MTSRWLWRALAVLLLSGGAANGEPPVAREALARYFARDTHTACRLEDQAMEVEIQASLPKLKKQGSMQGLKVISRSGQVAYQFLRFTGDKLVKTDVIARFLTAEVHPPEHLGNIGMTRQNYRFHFVRSAEDQGRTVAVYQLRPRKKREGLFKGELWLDERSGSPVRETGELVKSPSLFVRRVRFVRDYAGAEEAAGVCGEPRQTSITVETRIAGEAEMVIRQHPVASTWQPGADGTN